MSFKEIAAPLIQRGIPVVPLLPRTKIARVPDWQNLATTDPAQIEEWDRESPDSNAACVAFAKPDGVWFLEIDKPEVQQRILDENGKRPPTTFAVRSSPGRGHFYWKQSPASLAMGNIAQSFVKNEDWSARVDRAYVVAPGSLHPKTGQPYEVLSPSEIVEAPQWLINWLISQKVTTRTAAVVGDKIPHGSHDTQLTKIAGRLRRDGLEEDALADALIEICEKRCENYGSDYKEMCEKIAHSVARYPVGGEPGVALVNGVPAGTARLWTPGPVTVAVPEVELTVDQHIPYPVFPKWVMSGTSIFDGFIKPVCDVNSRYEEYMFIPAIAIMMNYLATKVRLEVDSKMIPSLYLVLIGKKGKLLKSSSVADAVDYFSIAGVSGYSSGRLSNAEGRSLVFTAGSMEGLGMEMARLNCKNAILYYDELSTLTKKAGIESSTMNSNLLTVYESGFFHNTIKGRKETYSFDPGTYCISLIACSTTRGFLPAWSQLASKSSGLEDRFFFLMQPKELKPVLTKRSVNYAEGALRTRKMIEKAIEKSVYKMDDFMLVQYLNRGALENREAIRAEKFALYFAIDRGMDEIDGECMERALALVNYEKSVKKYLQTYEGSSRDATLQMEIESELRKAGGAMNTRKLYQRVHGERAGTFIWERAFNGLIRIGKIAETGAGGKSDPKITQLLWVTEDDEDE